ncbi:hypothetical protein PROVRETT_05938 [Providencia rettgeri DSM 1131]|nr:hypothetical protein PROVRETT_05938 [Providencia rettgeri DSM 1131]
MLNRFKRYLVSFSRRALAFFRISFSILSSLFSFRSLNSSALSVVL